MPRRVYFIVNLTAGAGVAVRSFEDIWRRLVREGIEASRCETQAAGHAVDLARDAAQSGKFDVVVAVGGDGTAREVAAGVLDSAAPATAVALLPLGTGNDLAHVAGTGDVPAALAAIAAGTVRRMDAIEVTCQIAGRSERTHAMSFAAVGLAADVVRYTTPAIKRWCGPKLCYSVGFFRALARYRPVTATAICDGREFRDTFVHICAGNTSHAGGRIMHLSPGAMTADGELNISLIHATSRVEVARQFIRLLRGTHVQHPRAHYFLGRDIAVQSTVAADVQLDGDCVGTTPARFRVVPGALHLVVPPGSNA